MNCNVRLYYDWLGGWFVHTVLLFTIFQLYVHYLLYISFCFTAAITACVGFCLWLLQKFQFYCFDFRASIIAYIYHHQHHRVVSWICFGYFKPFSLSLLLLMVISFFFSQSSSIFLFFALVFGCWLCKHSFSAIVHQRLQRLQR